MTNSYKWANSRAPINLCKEFKTIPKDVKFGRKARNTLAKG